MSHPLKLWLNGFRESWNQEFEIPLLKSECKTKVHIQWHRSYKHYDPGGP